MELSENMGLGVNMLGLESMPVSSLSPADQMLALVAAPLAYLPADKMPSSEAPKEVKIDAKDADVTKHNASGNTPDDDQDDFPTVRFEDIRIIEAKDLAADRQKGNNYSHDTQIGVYKEQEWVIKRVLRPEDIGKTEKKREKEKTAREVFMSEVARYLCPDFPETRAVKDKEGNYYIMSRRIPEFETLNELFRQNPARTDISMGIHSGEIINAGVLAVITHFLADADAGIHNMARVRIPDAKLNGPRFKLVGFDRGQAGAPHKYFTLYDEKTQQITHEYPHQITSAGFERLPQASLGSFEPNNYDDSIAHREEKTSSIFTDRSRSNLLIRKEINDTTFDICFLTDDILEALGNQILRKYSRKENYLELLRNQRNVHMNSAVSANPLRANFRDYASPRIEHKEEKSELTEHYVAKAETFQCLDQPLFAKGTFPPEGVTQIENIRLRLGELITRANPPSPNEDEEEDDSSKCDCCCKCTCRCCHKPQPAAAHDPVPATAGGVAYQMPAMARNSPAHVGVPGQSLVPEARLTISASAQAQPPGLVVGGSRG